MTKEELEKENAELQEKISVLLSCKKCPENKGGWICVKEYEDKCLAQKITFIKELKKENAEMKEQLTKAMKKKVIYISGKITGTSDYADRFSAVENKLIAEGYEVMNPVREGKWLEHYLEPEKPTWVQYMKYDIATMMKADHIYMMRGWKQSKGARVEHFLARALSYTIIYEEEQLCLRKRQKNGQQTIVRDVIAWKEIVLPKEN